MLEIIWHAQWFFLLYFILLNGGYIILNIFSLFSISRYMQSHEFQSIPQAYAGYLPPISILVPAHNEEVTDRKSVV